MARNCSPVLLNITVTLALVTLTLCVPDSKAVLRELLAQIKADNRLPPSRISHNSARHSSLSEQLAVLEAQQLQREEQAATAALLEDDEQQQPLQQQQQQQRQHDVSESFPAVGDSAVRTMVKLAASYLASKDEDAADGYLSSPKRGFFIAASGGPGGANMAGGR